MLYVALAASLQTRLTAQETNDGSGFDDVGDDFFDTLSSPEPIDAQERPRQPKLQLPATLDDVPIFPNQTLSPELHAWTRWLILNNLPPVYEDNKKWGKVKEVYDGFRFRREGLKVETYRKWKTVKQGTWSRYYIEFVDPENSLELLVDQIRPLDASKIGLRVALAVPLKIFGRVAQWQHDVQLISISTNADATVEMVIDAECEVIVNPLAFPPDVMFRPKATAAQIAIRKFEVHRISQLHGPLAEQLGKGLRNVLDDRLADMSDKLVEKINRQFIKQQDKLQIKLHDRIAGTVKSWTEPQ